jgi:hypothetical protein
MNRVRRLGSESGVYSILYAIVVVILVMTAAIVVDLSGLREDRRAARLATDAAATAGAIKLNALNGAANAQDACQEAWRFLKVNLPGAGSATAACPTSTFPTSFTVCPADAMTATGAAGPWQVTITWPVPDDNSLMTEPNITGLGSFRQPIDTETDGADRCGRLGVTVSRKRDFLFAGIGGFTNATTANSSVARADLRGQRALEFPLVVLDQHGCDALTATGSGPSGAGITIKNNGITPGRIALDSAADLRGNNSPGCDNLNSYVAQASGGSRIVAWNGTSGGLGQILAYGPLTKAAPPSTGQYTCPAGTNPATVTDRLCPAPTSFIQLTRKYWDWKYHCTATTSAPLSAPCPYTATVPDYIGQHRASYGANVLNASNAVSKGFTLINGSDCDGTAGYRYYPPGQYYVDCATFKQNHTTVFGGGVVVFRGNVDLKGQSGGPYCTVFNQQVGVTPPSKDANGFYPVCNPPPGLNSLANPPQPMYVYLQNGSLSRQNSDLIATETFFYQEADAAFGGNPNVRIQIGAGTSSGGGVSGTLLLTAPNDGPFDNLAVWSENTAPSNDANGLGAQTKIDLEGIFFLPNGQVNFTGNGLYLGPPRAQFVAWRLATTGGASLEMVPDAERTLAIPVGGVRLIR